MQNREKLVRASISATIAVIVFATGLFVYNYYMEELVERASHTALEETVMQQAFNFTSKIEGETSAIKMLARSIAVSDNVDDISTEMLHGIAEVSAFDYMIVVDKHGRARFSNGRIADLNDRYYFHRALGGETILSEPVQSKIRNAKIIVLATPIIHKGKIVGVLMGSYLANELDKLFLPSWGGMGYAFITTNEGVVVSKTVNGYSLLRGDNLFEPLRKANFYQYDDFDTVYKRVHANESGHAKYIYNNSKRIMHYMTINVNDWNIFSIVPEEVVSRTANKITLSTAVLSLIFTAVFIGLVLGILSISRRNMDKLTEMAFVDEITKAPTLAKFKLDAQKILDNNPDKKFVLVKNDIDKFKLINQVLGFETGDMVLKNTVAALRASAPGSRELIARVNVDEFLVLHEYTSEAHLSDMRNVFLNTFKALLGEDFKYDIRFVSGHYYMQFETCRDIVSAIERANIAHRKAKESGVDVCVYDEAFIKEALRRKYIENKMEAALVNGNFKVFLQPKYALINETIAGAEALVRWYDGDNGMIMPGDFIPLFEANGFVTKLDMYMFEKVCAIIKGWIDAGIKPVTVSVNFSRNHLANTNFVESLYDMACKYGVPCEYLEIELTETVIFDNEAILLDVLAKLHEKGFTLSMDDFGTGYSSLGLLKNIPVDVIKIDRSFFNHPDCHGRSKTVLLNVIRMAKELDIHTVAEGVETSVNVALLRDLGCDMVQGYYYARPMPEAEFTERLKKV